MYEYYSDDLFALAALAPLPPSPPPPIPPIEHQDHYHNHDDQLVQVLDLDSTSVHHQGLKSEVMNSYSSSSSSSYGSPTSSSLRPNNYFFTHQIRPCTLVQRSMSTNSIFSDHHAAANSFHLNNPLYSHLDDSSFSHHEVCWDSDTCPMRKVFSTGDLQRVNLVHHSNLSESPLLHENITVEGMNKVGRYSAEERKERIERYRSKRHQRNFNKKIKYACRKTLADSRPRIRGRFARNEEIEESPQAQWYQMGKEEIEEDRDVWFNFLDAFSVNLIP